MPASTRPRSISENEASFLGNGGPDCKPGPPAYTRRKEIVFGTPDKINPARTMARRVALVYKAIGPATGYYYWIVERIGSTDRTRFWCADAAEVNGVTVRTIKNHNKRLVQAGFLKINHRKHKGQNSYAEYVLQPINRLIGDGDDGSGNSTAVTSNRVKRLSPGPGEKLFPTKRAINKNETVSPAVPPSRSTPNPTGSENAEAGRAGASPSASASFGAGQGREDSGFDSDETQPTPATPNLKSEVTAWCKTNLDQILGYGFKHRDYVSLRTDILRHITIGGVYDSEMWSQFVEWTWPRLQITLPGIGSFLNNTKLGPGWLFRTNDDTNQPNYMDVILGTSRRENDFTLPETLFAVGDTCYDRDWWENVTVTGYTHQSYLVRSEKTEKERSVNVWRVEAPRFTVEVAPPDPSVPSAAPAEPVFVASGGTSEAREAVEAVAGTVPCPDAKEDEELAELRALLAAVE